MNTNQTGLHNENLSLNNKNEGLNFFSEFNLELTVPITKARVKRDPTELSKL